jgi:hypothetical protein
MGVHPPNGAPDEAILRLAHQDREAPMTWQQACDWVDDIIDRQPDQDDAAPYPALHYLDREMREAERELDNYEEQELNQ